MTEMNERKESTQRKTEKRKAHKERKYVWNDRKKQHTWG